MAEEKKVGFVSMSTDKREIGDIPEIGIGMIGHAFMGKAHSNAWKQMLYIFWPPPLMPKLVKIAGVHEDSLRESAKRYGFQDHTTDWKDLISNAILESAEMGKKINVHYE